MDGAKLKNDRNVLPPLDYLLAFESAAMCQSFAGASRELNISETAISRKVKLLELHYDVALFLRRHRSIRLTPQGQILLDSVRPAMQMLRHASREMLSDHQKNTVTLAATNSVTSLWLMPKLRKFRRQNKHLKIMLVASDNDQECLADNVDISILRGDGNWPGYRSRLLFGETIFPVCSPDYLAANPEISNLENMTSHGLIDVTNIHTEWMNWKTWLAQYDYDFGDLNQAVFFNTYPLAIEAAVDGLGVALGWGHLVDHLVKSGKLVRPLEAAEIRTNHGYYLLHPEKRQTFPECSVVENWLTQESANRKRYRTRS
ncbi:MAG: LysR family transcriptional regulator [Rhodobacteraceae bacterium]|nr:LysR family transcriptional regulator [Paracoccaceae bacterium]